MPTKREKILAKVQLHKYGDVPDSFKQKVGVPRVCGSEQSILAKSCQDIFSRRALVHNFTVSRDYVTEVKKKQTTTAKQNYEETKIDLRLTETVN